MEKSDFRSAEARDFGRVALEELFETMLVGPGVPVDKVAQMIIANVGTHNRLQLGFSLLQLLVASVGQHHSWRDVSSIVRRCTPDCKGPPEGKKFGRQRDLLPLPLPAFGATLKLARLLKCPASGLVLWRSSINKQVGRQQLKKLCNAACFQTWRLLGVMVLNGEATGWERLAPASVQLPQKSQGVALEFIGRQCEWWSRHALEERPPGNFDELARARNVDYSGEEVLKALPLRLEELAPGLPDDGVAGSLDVMEVASEDVKRWVADPSLALLDPEMWPDPLPTASMRVSRDEWIRIVRVLFAKGIVEGISLEEVHHVRGSPVLNGVFAVEKSGTPSPGESRITRLIMNLVPSNSLQRLMTSDLPTLAGSSQWSGIQLRPDEVLLWSGDDQKGAFYAWRLPVAWRGLMTFKMPVPGDVVGRPDVESMYVAAAVIPMGWLNAVSLFQHLHRRVGLTPPPTGAGLDPQQEWRRDRPMPRGAMELGGTWYQYYLDDFDCPEKVPKHTWRTLVGTLSPTHARQRAAYDRVGVGISQKKAHVREPCVTRMGAEIDGIEGRLSAPTPKMLEVGWLTVWLLARPVISPRMLMVLLGRFTRCFEFRRPLMGLLNAVWPKSMWCRPRKLTSGKMEELVKAAVMLPFASTSLRTPVSGLVTCSDASTLGGGMCASSGLTHWGKQCLDGLDNYSLDGEFFKPQGSMKGGGTLGPRMVVVSLFDGVGSIMCAATRLPFTVRGYASSEIDKDCMRLTRTRWPGIIELGDVRKITAKAVDQLASSIGYRLDLVLLSAGCPCSGYEEAHLWLQEVVRVHKLLKQSFGVSVELLVEAMFPLSQDSLFKFNEVLQLKPLLVDAKYLSWMHRPRLFWVTWAVKAVEGESLCDAGGYTRWDLRITRESKQSWVDVGGQWLSPEGILLPDCTAPTPRRTIPRSATGLDDASDQAKARWAEDSYKLPVSHYETEHMITNDDESLRILSLAEWEKLLGFDDNYIVEGLHSKYKGTDRQIRGGQLLGSAFHVFAVMVLLDELFYSYAGARNRYKTDFFSRGVAPTSWTLRPTFVKKAGSSDQVSRLVSHFLRVAERGGTDVRLDVGVPFRAKAWPRSGVQSQLFEWAIVHGYSWSHEAHINALELQAVLNSVKWRLRQASNCCQRALVLIDSQVVCAIIAKGRTSSGKLRRSLQSLNAFCLAGGLFLAVAYVDTGNNPADIPSRWCEQRSRDPGRSLL